MHKIYFPDIDMQNGTNQKQTLTGEKLLTPYHIYLPSSDSILNLDCWRILLYYPLVQFLFIQ